MGHMFGLQMENLGIYVAIAKSKPQRSYLNGWKPEKIRCPDFLWIKFHNRVHFVEKGRIVNRTIIR